MRPEDARTLLHAAVRRAEVWADLGAGRGTFTTALAGLVGAGGRVIAVDEDAGALPALARLAGARPDRLAPVTPARGDFHRLDDVPELAGVRLDGILFANALHFSRDAGAVLASAARRVAPSGRIVVVEYAHRRPSRWVPYPLGFARLEERARENGLAAPRRLAEVPSDYGGAIYSAVLEASA